MGMKYVGIAIVGSLALGVACSSQPAPPSGSHSSGEPAPVLEAPGAGVAQVPIVPWTGLPRGVMPMRKGGKAKVGASGCPGANLVYWGGQVLQNVVVYNVNWSSAVDSTVQAQMPLFYAAVTQSALYDWLSEYDTLGVTPQDGMPGTNQGIQRGSGGGTFTLTPSVCSGTTPCTISDMQIQTELASQIAAGSLPAPTTGCDGFTSSIYMFQFPQNVTINGPMGAGQSCASFCAYHFSTHVNGLVVPYGVLPDVNNGACAGGCGSDPTPINNSTTVATHELVEATTDTDVGDIPASAPGYARPAAWGDNNCGEIGDICAGFQDFITVGGRQWAVQQEWSNQANNCITTKTTLPPLCTDANTPPGCRKCTCADANEPAGCTGGTPWCETDATNVRANDCVQCTLTSQCAAGSTCLKSMTPSQDDICSGGVMCGGSGQVCCMGNTCNTGLVCVGGTCAACGGPGQPCCAGNTCNPPDTCNAGTCGCTPFTMCPAPDNCGTLPDGCGGTINCGTCPGGVMCVNNQCQGCVPQTCPGLGAMCGTPPDGCGGTLNCGTCPAGQTCNASYQCQQTCVPQTCATLGAMCGMPGDGCGAVLNCGTCPSGETCSAGYQCVAGPPDSGTDSGGMDSGSGGDSGTPSDSGSSDSGSAADSGTARDSGIRGDSGLQGGDSGQGGGDGAASNQDGGSGGSGNTGGCGCRVTAPHDSSTSFFGIGALAVLGVTLRLRRRRQRSAA